MSKLGRIQARLEELRTELRTGRMSYGELAELADLAAFIGPEDVELLEAAGGCEHCRKQGHNADDCENEAAELRAKALEPYTFEIDALNGEAKIYDGNYNHIDTVDLWDLLGEFTAKAQGRCEYAILSNRKQYDAGWRMESED